MCRESRPPGLLRLPRQLGDHSEEGLPIAILQRITALATWPLFPPLVLFAAREHLRRDKRSEPRPKLQTFRRWQRAVIMSTLLGLPVTFFLFGPQRFFALGFIGPGIMPAMVLLPMSLSSLAARLIGLPLEREAWPQRREIAWWRLLAPDLIGTAIMLLFLTAVVALPAFIRSGRFPIPAGASRKAGPDAPNAVVVFAVGGAGVVASAGAARR